jgi:hypothetical protein
MTMARSTNSHGKTARRPETTAANLPAAVLVVIPEETSETYPWIEAK